MQVLYQLDLRGQDDAPMIRLGLDQEHGDTSALCDEAFALAMGAWENHHQADTAIAQLAPRWPTHRQPPVDRAILRLAHHELVTGRAPSGVVINEAVVLAKRFCSEQAPGFINGVLDRVARQLVQPEAAMPTQPHEPVDASS